MELLFYKSQLEYGINLHEMEKGRCRDERHLSCHDWNSSDEKRESEPTDTSAKCDLERDHSDDNQAGGHYTVNFREKLLPSRGVEGTHV